jgi:hypothetical protein
MKLEFHPEAELELLEAAFHYDLEVLVLANSLGLRSNGLPTFFWSTRA